jgi:hypothetical protein
MTIDRCASTTIRSRTCAESAKDETAAPPRTNKLAPPTCWAGRAAAAGRCCAPPLEGTVDLPLRPARLDMQGAGRSYQIISPPARRPCLGGRRQLRTRAPPLILPLPSARLNFNFLVSPADKYTDAAAVTGARDDASVTRALMTPCMHPPDHNYGKDPIRNIHIFF